MKGKSFVGLLMLAIFASSAYGQDWTLKSSLEECVADEGVRKKGIGSEIVSSVAVSLVGTAVDAIVTYLGTPQIVSVETTIPVDRLADLKLTLNKVTVRNEQTGRDEERDAHSGKCLSIFYVEGDAFRPMASIAFVAAPKESGKDLVFRPVVLSWNHPGKFLEEGRVLRSKIRRDVLITLEFFSPGAKFSGDSPASTPVGMLIEDVTTEGIKQVFANDKGASLPWVKLAESDGPINIRFKITETSKPGAFSTALAAAIKAQKSAIQDKVKSHFTEVSESAEVTATLQLVEGAQKAAATYQASYATAAATLLAIRTGGDDVDLTALGVRYATERETARLNLILAKAAFQVAGIEWPADDFGNLPEKP